MKLLILTTLISLLSRVPSPQQWFQQSWKEDNRRIELIRDYMRQTEKQEGTFDCRCESFLHIGQPVATPLRFRSTIELALNIHHSRTNVCFFKKLPDGIYSDPGGNIFLDVQLAEKLDTTQMLAVLGHELGHRYAFRVLDTDGHAAEYYADIVSAWTMRVAGYGGAEIISALYVLSPKAKESKSHPSHKDRERNLHRYLLAWDLLLAAPELCVIKE